MFNSRLDLLNSLYTPKDSNLKKDTRNYVFLMIEELIVFLTSQLYSKSYFQVSSQEIWKISDQLSLSEYEKSKAALPTRYFPLLKK